MSDMSDRMLKECAEGGGADVCCDDFAKFAGPVHTRWQEMSKGELFVTDIEDLWEKYLAAFPEGTNPVFRERSQHDCQTCRQFVRRLGRLVAISGGATKTVWGGLDLPYPYSAVAQALDAAVKGAAVNSVFRSKERQFGVDHNYDPKTNERYDHFHGTVADRHFSKDADTKRGEQDSVFQVMRRGLTELKLADLESVIDLIQSNGLYRGEEHREAVQGFVNLLRDFQSAGQSDLFVWEHLSHRYARFRNTVIGTLLVELADGKEFEQAVKSFEAKVAPANYKRPTAVITQKMVEQAVETLTKLGLAGAIQRRYARLSDVSVNDVLWVDNESKGKMKDGISELLAGSVKQSAPDLKHATTCSAADFVANILPTAKRLDCFVENRHVGNFVSLTGADGPERPFKWGNNFAWSYDGNVTDSVKQRVKAAGGNVNALLRVSLSWFNTDDLDLHAILPTGTLIYYANKMGVLDVDMNAHVLTRNPVENLAFSALKDGVYRIGVNQFRRRESADAGFAIEVEFGGVVHQYSHPRSPTQGETVECFRLHIKGGKLEKIETALVGGASSQEKWGVKTESLVPVAAAMYSPNAWNGSSVGAKHLILALKGCRNPEPTRGLYNEHLDGRLYPHRKVFEVLGSRATCPYSDEQVSGLGFTAARGDSVTVVVDGKRAYTLTF